MSCCLKQIECQKKGVFMHSREYFVNSCLKQERVSEERGGGGGGGGSYL